MNRIEEEFRRKDLQRVDSDKSESDKGEELEQVIKNQSNELKENKKHFFNSKFLSFIIITLVVTTSILVIIRKNG